MYLHQVNEALQAGKKIKRNGWNKKTFIMKAKPVSAFELDETECKAIGVPAQTIATPGEDCLLLIEDGTEVTIGYALTHEDKTSQDWDLV